MSQVFKLFRLQQIDIQLDQTRSHLFEIIKQLENDADLQQAQENYNHQHQKVNELEKKLRLIEKDVEQQYAKIRESEDTLYSGHIKNPKELKDLEDEVKALKRYLQVLEERQLEVMIALDEEKKIHNDLERDLEKVKHEVLQRNSRYLGEKTELEKEIQRLENERAIAVASLEPDYYERYQSIRVSKKGIAVSRVQEKSCSACGTTLTGGLIQEARAPSRLAFCPSCGRILYGG
ncbi:MAG: C4-type zinc ribbon domain-containing protein [Anaerolineales bacterium]|nr:C4-type zinc ribbon domain-containing protein [Anaerolineales bacterium]